MVQGDKHIPKKGKHYNDRKAAHKQSMIANKTVVKDNGDDNEQKEKIQVPKVIAAGGIHKDKSKNQNIEKKGDSEVVKNNTIKQEKKNKEVQKVLGKNRKEGKKDKKDKKHKKNEKKDDDKQSKKEKKEKKDIEVEEESSDEDNDSDQSSIQLEADNLADLDAEMEKQNEVLGELSVLKNAGRKKSKEEKERKVTEFKFRVLDLLEIFVKKTNNPQLFLISLSQIFNSLQQATQDKQKTPFVDKICQVIKKFFERNFTFEGKYIEEVDTCLSEVMRLLAKESRNSLNKLLSSSALSLLKIRVSMNGGDATAEFVKALDKTGLKKDIFYSESLFKEALKISNSIAIALMNRLFELALLNKDGGSKDRNKGIILSLLSYAVKNPTLQKHIKENPKEQIDMIIKLCSVFSQHEEIKKKKIAVLKKYVEIFQTISTILHDVESPLKKQLSEQLLSSLNSWDENDHNLQAVKKKITEKCIF